MLLFVKSHKVTITVITFTALDSTRSAIISRSMQVKLTDSDPTLVHFQLPGIIAFFLYCHLFNKIELTDALSGTRETFHGGATCAEILQLCDQKDQKSTCENACNNDQGYHYEEN